MEQHWHERLISQNSEEKLRPYIIALSVLIPVVVAALFRVKLDVAPLTFLPPIYATINFVTAGVLMGALLAIKQGKRDLHVKLIITAMGLGATFLVCYVAYHITSDPTLFGDANGNGMIDSDEAKAIQSTKFFYYFVLISHIILSIAVVPLVLLTFSKGIAGKWRIHRRLAKVTFPIWLYVTVSGVVVYLMIQPYYQ